MGTREIVAAMREGFKEENVHVFGDMDKEEAVRREKLSWQNKIPQRL